ncbi:MAG TPA: hypothetical protein ENH82_09540 [bacterium]|nr:hypothetical protein [bacterium]
MIVDYTTKFDIGDVVYLKTDIDQLERIVTAITLRPNGCILYSLSLDTIETLHYDLEISTGKDILKSVI